MTCTYLRSWGTSPKDGQKSPGPKNKFGSITELLPSFSRQYSAWHELLFPRHAAVALIPKAICGSEPARLNSLDCQTIDASPT
mmetsp:Transcript_19952/g.47912  ORF Transcript_19952/g.47912 Transcript_19952/m.47912 type:complete len:83 (-) Transcript_19952:1248-1496(-)